MLVANDMGTIAAIANAFCDLSKAGVVTVVRIKDRFTEPSAGGWSDLMINFVVDDGHERRHVCEVQVVHQARAETCISNTSPSLAHCMCL